MAIKTNYEDAYDKCTGGPIGNRPCSDCVDKMVADARAAGYAEAIEKAAKVAEGEYMSLSGHPNFRNAKLIAKRIRMLAPATTREPK